jgi:hypothetical protein
MEGEDLVVRHIARQLVQVDSPTHELAAMPEPLPLSGPVDEEAAPA